MAVEETLAYSLTLVEDTWLKILRYHTNNPLERILRKIRRRTSWAPFLTVNRRSTSPPPGCATSPAQARVACRGGVAVAEHRRILV
jgi:hypothetical protein